MQGSLLRGCDYSYTRPDPAKLAASGIKFVIRYVSDRPVKNITRKEADGLAAHGIAVVTNCEYRERSMLEGYNTGVVHATEANRQHLAAGGPADKPCFFAVDFDASEQELEACYEYVKGAIDVLGVERTGVYGGVRTMRFMAERGIKWLYQTSAWSREYRAKQNVIWDPRAQIRQHIHGLHLAGGLATLDWAMVPDIGQWTPQEVTT